MRASFVPPAPSVDRWETTHDVVELSVMSLVRDTWVIVQNIKCLVTEALTFDEMSLLDITSHRNIQYQLVETSGYNPDTLWIHLWWNCGVHAHHTLWLFHPSDLLWYSNMSGKGMHSIVISQFFEFNTFIRKEISNASRTLDLLYRGFGRC